MHPSCWPVIIFQLAIMGASARCAWEIKKFTVVPGKHLLGLEKLGFCNCGFKTKLPQLSPVKQRSSSCVKGMRGDQPQTSTPVSRLSLFLSKDIYHLNQRCNAEHSTSCTQAARQIWEEGLRGGEAGWQAFHPMGQQLKSGITNCT